MVAIHSRNSIPICGLPCKDLCAASSGSIEGILGFMIGILMDVIEN